MFCRNCGNRIDNEQIFCGNCGEKIPQSTNVSTPNQAVDSRNPMSQKTNIKKIFGSIGIVISVIVTVCVIFNIISNTSPRKVDFNLEYDRIEIQEFMDAVCKNLNSDIEYAHVGRVEDSYGKYLMISIKPQNAQEQNIEVYFNGDRGSNSVSFIEVKYKNYDTYAEAVCKDAIVEALEISFCGCSNAKTYTSKFNSMGTKPANYELKSVAEYSLTDNAEVRISWQEVSGTPAFEWTGIYRIYNNEGE